MCLHWSDLMPIFTDWVKENEKIHCVGGSHLRIGFASFLSKETWFPSGDPCDADLAPVWKGVGCITARDFGQANGVLPALLAPLTGSFMVWNWISFYYAHQYIPLIIAYCCCSVTKSCLTLGPHGLQHARPPCPSPSPGICSNSCPLSRWCRPTSYPLSSPSPPALSLSQHQGLFQWVGSSHQVTKVLELQL